MKKSNMISMIFLTTLLLFPLISYNTKAATIGDTAFGVEIGDVLVYEMVGSTNVEDIGNKMSYTIQSIFRDNSSTVIINPGDWMGAIINITTGFWNKTTEIWTNNEQINSFIAFNVSTKNIAAHPSWLNIIPTPINLTFIAKYFETLDIGVGFTENYTVSLSGNTLNITINTWTGYVLGNQILVSYTYNEQGIATRFEQYFLLSGTYYIFILEISNDGPSIPFENIFIGITCVSIVAVAIIVRKRIKTHKKI